MKNILFVLFLSLTFLCKGQWQDLGTGLSVTSMEIYSISVVDTNIVWAVGNTGFGYVNEFTKTTDGGNTWQPGFLPTLTGSYFTLSVKALDEDTAWIMMTVLPTQDSNRLFKTIDGGVSWTEQFGGFNQTNWALAIMHFFDGNNGVLYGSSGTGNSIIDSLHIHTTNDGGTTWSRVPSSNLPTPLPDEGNWIYSGNGNFEVVGDTMWALTRANRVFKTIDKGLNWQAYPVTNNSDLVSIAFKDDLNGVLVGRSPNYIGITDDGGLTWTNAFASLAISSFRGIDYIPETDNAYMIWSQNSTRFAITLDGGNTWSIKDYSVDLTCLEFVSPTVGYGGNRIQTPTERGMYKWSGGDAITSVSEVTSNNDLTIYPNPTKDNLFLESTNKVSLIQITDVSGRIKGEYSVSTSIDISNLSSGIYFLKLLMSDDNVIIKKFVKN